MAPAGHVGHPRQVPLDVLRDTIQPFPTFSEIYADALKALRRDRRRRPTTTSPAASLIARSWPATDSTRRSHHALDIAPGGTFPDYELPDHTTPAR